MRLAAPAAGAGVAVLVTTAALLGWRDGSPLVPRNGGLPGGDGARLFLGLLVAAYVVYLAGLVLVRRGARTTVVVVLAVVVQLGPLAGPLLLSTDAWTYWSYGWLASRGDNPYVAPPSSRPDNPALPFTGAAWRDTTSVYGPAFTLASEPVARVTDDETWTALIFRALAALAVIAAALLAARLSSRPALAAAFVGWNPLLAIHAAGGGHNDAWVGALLLAALALEASRRTVAGGVAWTCAIFVKWVPLPLLALHLLSPATSRRSRLIGSIAISAVVAAAIATARYGTAWLGAAGPLATNALRETRFAVPARLEQLGVPHGAALGAAAAVFVAGFAWLARDAIHGRARLAAAACLALLTTPYLAVWYLGWAVPLAAADDDDRAARLCCLALGAYLLPQAVPL